MTMVDGNWLAVKRTDKRAFALYRRHYSAKKNLPYRHVGNTNVTGSGETMVLLSQLGTALFVWLRNTVERLDHQHGVNCTVFRNEGAGLSSDLIREADDLAWQRWTDEPRHFTYVDPKQIRHKRDPGRCFLKAGWRKCGVSAEGKLIFERVKEQLL
jgi:hypothetical protein